MKAGHSKRIVFRDNLLHRAIFERPSQADRVFTYSYDAIGRPATITYPAGTGIVAKFEDDSATANSGFDANGNLLHLRYEKGGTLIRRFEWTYDDSNNRQSQLEFVPGTPGTAIKWEYGFDWFDRLTSVKRAEATTVAGLPATALQREYEFDESDNRRFFDDHINSKTYHYKYKSIDDNGTTRYSDQLEEILTSTTVGDRVLANFTSLETFIHDADGNMTKRIKTGEEISFQWSDYDRLLRVESDTTGRKQDNRYDFNGIRKRKLDKNGNSSREYTAGISTSTSRADLGSTVVPTISYLSIGGAIVGYEEDDGTSSTFNFFITDALSSVRDIVDDSGNVVQSYEYDENGNQLPGSGQGSVDSPKTYWGGLSVNDDTGDSGLYLAGHRHFDPSLGRFISRDPIGFAGGLNLYSLSANNQVTFADPTGLQPHGTGETGGSGLSPVEWGFVNRAYEVVKRYGGPGIPKLDTTRVHSINDSLSAQFASFLRPAAGLTGGKNIYLNPELAKWGGAKAFVGFVGILANELVHQGGDLRELNSSRFELKVLEAWQADLDTEPDHSGPHSSDCDKRHQYLEDVSLYLTFGIIKAMKDVKYYRRQEKIDGINRAWSH